MDSLQYFDLVLDHLQSNNGLRQTVTGVAKQAAYAASGAAAGGLLLGPVGALGGSIVGSVVGYARADNYPNVFVLAQQLDKDQKKALVQSIMIAAGGLTIEHFYKWYSADQSNRNVVMSLVSAAAALAQSPT